MHSWPFLALLIVLDSRSRLEDPISFENERSECLNVKSKFMSGKFLMIFEKSKRTMANGTITDLVG